MPPLCSYDLLIFDCDGVIVDSNRIKLDVMEEAVIEAGFTKAQALECKAYFSANFGKSRFFHVRHFVDRLLKIPDDRRESTYKLILNYFSKGCRKHYQSADITPGFKEVLKTLRGKKAVASGSEQDELRALLEAKGINREFECVYGSPTSKTKNVEVILNEIPHRRAVMIGDAVADFEAASENMIDFVAYIPFSNTRDQMIELAKEHDFTILETWPIS